MVFLSCVCDRTAVLHGVSQLCVTGQQCYMVFLSCVCDRTAVLHGVSQLCV